MKPRRLDSPTGTLATFSWVELISPGSSLVHLVIYQLFLPSTNTPVRGKFELQVTAAWTFTTNICQCLCSEAQVFSQKHSHDLSQVLHSGAMHVLLCVVHCMPELREGSGDDMKHGNPCMCVGGKEEHSDDEWHHVLHSLAIHSPQ